MPSPRPRSTRPSLCLLAVLAAAGACGRIPPLADASTPTPSEEDAGLAVADAALDGRKAADLRRGTGGTGGDVGSERAGGLGGAGGTTSTCSGIEIVAASRQPGDVLLVLDRSGSMNFSIDEECSCDPTSNPKVVCADTVNCRTRWASLVSGLDSTMSSSPFLHWGLKLFSSPTAGPCEVLGGVEVPVAGDATTAIRAQIATTVSAGETPTAAALTAAVAYLETLTDANRKMILLATDGKPNCGGDPPSVYEEDLEGALAAISAAVDAGFLVYVVGIGTGASRENLDTFARTGATGHHYPAKTADELATALDSISKAATCAFSLVRTPPDPNQIAVYLDKSAVARDESNGWTFGASTRTVVFHGSSCDQALSASPDAVQVLFTCGMSPPTLLP